MATLALVSVRYSPVAVVVLCEISADHVDVRMLVAYIALFVITCLSVHLGLEIYPGFAEFGNPVLPRR